MEIFPLSSSRSLPRSVCVSITLLLLMMIMIMMSLLPGFYRLAWFGLGEEEEEIQ